jgi:hypothetical protein
LFLINGFNSEFSSRKSRMGGGITVYVSSKHCYSRLNIVSKISEDISIIS